MSGEFLAADDPRWAAFLERAPHDVYARPEYVACAARHDGGTAVAFYGDSGPTAILVPLIIRPLPPALGAPAEWRDARSPYGYPGIVTTTPDDVEGLARCLVAFREVGARTGLISAFLRGNPLRPTALGALSRVGQLVRTGAVVYLDLTQPVEVLASQMRASHRADIRKLGRDGFQATMDDWARYGEFIHLYRETMQRLGAEPFYFFSDTYFADLRRELAAQLHLCVVSGPQGDHASAGVFLAANGVVHYHLGATAEQYLRRAPTKLMVDCVRRWAQEAGDRVLNLGGGRGGADDQLLHFKAGFSPLRADFHTLRMVLDPERYAALTPSGAADDRSSYFPAYRGR
jgi:hypothetical protein